MQKNRAVILKIELISRKKNEKGDHCCVAEPPTKDFSVQHHNQTITVKSTLCQRNTLLMKTAHTKFLLICLFEENLDNANGVSPSFNDCIFEKISIDDSLDSRKVFDTLVIFTSYQCCTESVWLAERIWLVRMYTV